MAKVFDASGRWCMVNSSVYGDSFCSYFAVVISISNTINNVNSQIIKHAKEVNYGA